MTLKSPLAFSPVAETSSIEEAELLFSTTTASTRLLNEAYDEKFGVEMNSVLVGNTTFSFTSHSGSFEFDNGIVDGKGFHIFGYCVGGANARASTVAFDGKEIDLHRNAAVFTNGRTVRQYRAAGSSDVLVRSPIEELKRRVQVLLDRRISHELRFDGAVTMDNGVGAHAKSTITYILDSLSDNPSLLNNPLISSNFEELMLNILLSLPSNYAEELLAPGKKLRAPSLVLRAEEFMEASAHLPITIADVLAHTGGARKTLLANFRRYRGYTPNEFLNNVRLKLVHENLVNALPTDSVTSIAYNFGFSHLGRFSKVYRERYGINPSETLRQARRTH